MSRRPELVGRRQCWYERDMVIGVRYLVERSLGQGGQSIGIYIGDWCWSLPSLPPIPQYIPRHLDASIIMPDSSINPSTTSTAPTSPTKRRGTPSPKSTLSATGTETTACTTQFNRKKVQSPTYTASFFSDCLEQESGLSFFEPLDSDK